MQRVSFLILLLGFFNQSAFASSLPDESQTAMAFAKSAQLGMKLSVKHGAANGKISAAVADCVQSLEVGSFQKLFISLLTERLTDQEALVTETFFSTSVGQKYAKHGLLQVYPAVGEPLPEALPSFTNAELRELEKFSRTSAGNKLIAQKALQDQTAQQKIGVHNQSLLRACNAKNS